MSIASELITLNTAKQNIKQAIIDKGVDLTGVPFTNYHTKIAEISQGGSGGNSSMPSIAVTAVTQAGSDAGNKETQLTVTLPSTAVTAVIS